MKLVRALAAPLVAASLLATPRAFADGPGLPNLTYDPAEVFTVIGHVGVENGAPRAHGTASMTRGYLTVIFSQDSGKGDGGFAFYDISNPKAPVLVAARDDAETEDIREAHGFGFWGDYVALQATKGIQIWDWSDVTNPMLVSYLHLPGVAASDYVSGAWWLSWQAPYIYVGGSANGLFIVDAHDVTNPFLVTRPEGKPNPIPPSSLGGFRVGPVFAVGDRLGLTGMGEPGYAMLDIRDPVNPLLVSAKTLDMPKIYAGMMNGHRLYGTGDKRFLHVMDVSDPFQIIEVGKSGDIGGTGGYLSIQDGFAHVGASQRYAKVDVSPSGGLAVAMLATSNAPNRDEDFGTALGNLVAISDDHGNGTFFMPHQGAPDTTPPAVNMARPANGEANVALTMRVGLTFTDQIDRRTLDATTFIVRPVGGTALAGRYSYQTNIVNFAPDAPLLPSTTYEIILAQGGLKDLAGNAMADAFISYFSTGGAVQNPLCDLTPPGPAEVAASVSFTAALSTPMSGLMYSWDFGDGSPPTPVSPSPTANHVFSKPGHYTVNASVRDNNGLLTTCTLGQTIHRPLTPSRPTRSSTVMVSRAGDRVWVANPDSGSVSAIDTSTLQRLFEAKTGARPRAVAEAADGTVWVAVEGEARIAVLGPHDGHTLASIALPRGARPFAIVFSPDGSRAYATLQAKGDIVEIDPVSKAIVRTTPVGPTPRGLAVSADGARIFVTRFLSPLDHGEVIELERDGLSVVRTVSLALDPGPDTESSGQGVLNYLRGIAISPDGEGAWVVGKKDNTGRGAWLTGKPLTFESAVRSSVALLDLATGEERLSLRADLNDRSLPSAAEPSALGDFVFVATEGTNTVDVLDAYSGRLVTSIEGTGKAPDGLAIDASGQTLFVHAFLSRALIAYDIAGVVSLSGAPVTEIGRAETIAKEPLSPEVLLGKQIFYDASDRRMSRDKYLSCAVCHLDGEHDGRTWDFTDRGEGLRNTTTLAGKRGAGQGPLHWSANFDEIQDFEHDIRNAFLGTGFMSDEVFFADGHDVTLGTPKAGLSPELDALAAYVTSLDRVNESPYRNADGTMTDEAKRGEQIFFGLDCGSCHKGADLTDSAPSKLHDVGTILPSSGQRLGGPLTGIDTPTLKGLWETGPYLHDGSAATLDDVLARAVESGKHGDVGELSDDQKRALIAYLLQLDDTIIEAPSAGCGCRAAGEGAGGGAWALFAAALLGLRRRYRIRSGRGSCRS